jgi:uncharacterized protein (DUF2237 family)
VLFMCCCYTSAALSVRGTAAGWTRSGSCNWDPSDAGYHEVCVTMSSRFLDNSAKHDANDLTSVVSEGGHWCICAWAFAVRACPPPRACVPRPPSASKAADGWLKSSH